MQARLTLSPAQIHDDLLRFTLAAPSMWFWLLVVILGAIVGAGAIGIGVLVYLGLQFQGLTNVTLWSVQIVNFVYWAGVSHAGVMLSAVLRLTQAEWRRPITRAAEVLTVVALVTAAIFPLTHTGRPWRTLYWMFPYDFTRDVWPSVRSALFWDMSAIITYLMGTVVFVYLTLLPDLALCRERTSGWRRRVYGALSLGFRGTTRQWRLQSITAILLSVLILPVFVSDHSAVAWDLSMAIVPGWHSTVYGPYFLAGAVLAGSAAVVTFMVALRRALRLEQYLTPDHFDAMGRLLVVIASIWLFLLLMHFYFDVSGQDPVTLAVWELRLFTAPYNVLSPIMLLVTCVVPIPIWLIRRFRRNPAIMFWTSLLVTLGMYLERYILVVTPLSYKHPFVFTWIVAYEPRPLEYVVILSTFALVILGVTLFAKLFPIVPIYDVKEGQALRQEIQVGRVRVPAVVRASSASPAFDASAAAREEPVE